MEGYLLRKWNFETHEYEPFLSPAKPPILYSADMDFPVDCTQCGKHMIFGDTYTSKTIHTESGLGFPVCEDCYQVELKNEGII